jgi:ABC-type dipeptide/oligopeptide/nickel transport system permease component
MKINGLIGIVGVTLSVLRVRVKNRLVSWFLQVVSALLESIPDPLYVILLILLSLYLINQWHFDTWPVFPEGSPHFVDTLIPSLAVGLPGAFYMERTLSLKIEEEMHRAFHEL